MPVQHHSSSYRNVKKNTSFDPVWTQEPGSAEHAQDVAVWAPRDPETGKSSGCLICSVDTGTECYFRTHTKKSNRCFLQIYKGPVLLQKVLGKCKLSFINLFNTHYKFKHTMCPQQVCRAQNLLITVSGISGAPTLNHKSNQIPAVLPSAFHRFSGMKPKCISDYAFLEENTDPSSSSQEASRSPNFLENSPNFCILQQKSSSS